MLVDTSGLLCLIHRQESQHPAAADCYRRHTQRVLHNYVIAEWIALANARGVPRRTALAVADSIAEGTDMELVWVDVELHREALALLNARLDKGYSLCDAVSFVLMRRMGLTAALTSDRHFEQEGFRRLLV